MKFKLPLLVAVGLIGFAAIYVLLQDSQENSVTEISKQTPRPTVNSILPESNTPTPLTQNTTSIQQAKPIDDYEQESNNDESANFDLIKEEELLALLGNPERMFDALVDEMAQVNPPYDPLEDTENFIQFEIEQEETMLISMVQLVKQNIKEIQLAVDEFEGAPDSERLIETAEEHLSALRQMEKELSRELSDIQNTES